MRLIRLDEAPRERWRNDGGWTREIVRAPVGGADEYDWRLSAAEVERDGPFSHFAGCDRILVLLSGEGMALHSADSVVVLRVPGELLRFAGELPIDAALLDGPTTDLNLIWRRDRCTVLIVPAEPGARAEAGGSAHEVVVAFSLVTRTTRVGEGGERLVLGGDEREIAFVISPFPVN